MIDWWVSSNSCGTFFIDCQYHYNMPVAYFSVEVRPNLVPFKIQCRLDWTWLEFLIKIIHRHAVCITAYTCHTINDITDMTKWESHCCLSKDLSEHISDEEALRYHDDVTKRKNFPRYCPFVRGIYGHRWISLTKGQLRGKFFLLMISWWRLQKEKNPTLLTLREGKPTGHRWIPLTKASYAEFWSFSLVFAWTKSWANNRDASDLRRHRAHHDVAIMYSWMITSVKGRGLTTCPLCVDPSFGKSIPNKF